MWRALVVAAVGLVVSGCGGDQTKEPDAEAPDARTEAGGDAAADEREGFALVRGDDTLAVERYSRTGDSLEGEIRDVQEGSRLTYRATLGPEERITRIELALYPAGATEPSERATGEFRGDTLVAEMQRGGGPEVERLATPSGTMLAVANSIATLEQLVRRARTLGGDEVEIPMILIGRDEEEHEVIEQVRVSRIGADSVRLVLDPQSEVRASVSGEGAIQGATTADGSVRIVRLR